MDLNKKVIIKILGEQSLLGLSELKTKFVQRMNIEQKLSNRKLDQQITELYIDGYITKNDKQGGYFLSKKGKQELAILTATR